MNEWYSLVADDMAKLPDCINYYLGEYKDAKSELSMRNNRTIERHCAELPGIIEHRFAQLQELEAILEYLNILLGQLKAKGFRRYLENYKRSLSSQDCKRFAEGEEEVVEMQILVNEFALVRNKYLSLMKGLDAKNWMLGHISKLRVAGIEDAEL